jgi:AraC family transcriptional regulator of adaptative response/methylated-DNA-[protein]-cysteine methyltransferase
MSLAHDDNSLYAALLARDPAYDGFFFVGVTTTGIFCRLTCPARKPKRENVSFYSSAQEALDAGFRPCLRCSPLAPSSPRNGAVHHLREAVQSEPDRGWSGAELVSAGYEPGTVRRSFKRAYGMTFSTFAREQRLGRAVTSLQEGNSVIEAQVEAGYESRSGFRDAIGRLLGEAPARARHARLLTAQWIETPIGPMLAAADDAGLHMLEFADRRALPSEIARLRKRVGAVAFGEHPVLEAVAAQLDAYFAGERRTFELPLAQRATPFQARVWEALRQVPLGESRSYGDLARSLGHPTAVRAVARANGANEIAIVVPCHRIIGVDGALTGYGGHIWRKRWLLEHEQRMVGRSERGTYSAVASTSAGSNM